MSAEGTRSEASLVRRRAKHPARGINRRVACFVQRQAAASRCRNGTIPEMFEWRSMEALGLSFVGTALLLLLAQAAESFVASLRLF